MLYINSESLITGYNILLLINAPTQTIQNTHSTITSCRTKKYFKANSLVVYSRFTIVALSVGFSMYRGVK